MKFGNEIFQKMVAEWQEAYLDYNTLKLTLKPFNLIVKKYMKIPLPQTISNNPNFPANFSITNYSQEDLNKLTDFHEKFDYILNYEIQKVTNFFKAKLLEYIKRLRLFKINVTILHSMNFKKDYDKLKGELKNCFHLFYKEIILLLDFYSINHEACRKILKKQKKLYMKLPKKLNATTIEEVFHENSFLHKNIPKLHKLKQEFENLYLDNFYKIHSKDIGKNELNKITHGRFTSHWENFLNGMFLGFSTLLMILITILGFQAHLDPDNDDNFYYVFHGYRGFALILVYLWFLAWNVYGWSIYHINYRNIFGFNYHYSTLSEIVKRTSIFTAILMFTLLWYILIRVDDEIGYFLQFIPKEYAPLIGWVLFFSYIFFPNFKYFNGEGRKYFFKSIKNLLLYSFISVDFTMTWMTEQLISFVIPIRDIEFSICYYIGKISYGQDTLYCSFSERLVLVLVATAFPLFLRILQCLRLMYQNNHKFVFGSDFFNALKYLTTLTTVILSFFFSLEQNSNTFFTLWVIFAVLSTGYSFFWDIKMDWGFLQPNSKFKYLRNQLSYTKPGVYYISILTNIFMRFCWILTLSPGIMGIFIRKQSFNFIFGIIEMIRRAIWNFFKVEMEHIANCGGFKVVETYKLPFENFRFNTEENKILSSEYEAFDASATSKKNHKPNNNLEIQSERQISNIRKSSSKENSFLSQEIMILKQNSFMDGILSNKKIPAKYSIETIKNEVVLFKSTLIKNNCFIVCEDIDSSKDKDLSKSSNPKENKEENQILINSSYEENKEKELKKQTSFAFNYNRFRNKQSVVYTRSISPEEKNINHNKSNHELKEISSNLGLEIGEKAKNIKKKII